MTRPFYHLAAILIHFCDKVIIFNQVIINGKITRSQTKQKTYTRVELRFHIKYVSVIIVFIQLHVDNSYLVVLFDLERSNDFYKGALD